MNISRKTIGWAGVGVAAVALIVFAASDHGSNASNGNGHGPGGGMPPMEVSVSTVSKHTVPVYIDYVGTTEAMRIVTLQAKVSGHLLQQVAKDGADVNEGDLLYRIDPRDYQAAVDQAVAALRRDAAARDYNKSRQSRNTALAQDGWVAKDALEQSGSALQQSDAVLAADEAAIRTARLRLSYTDIKAPFPGRLSRSLVHEGSFINAEAGTQLNTLVQLDPIRVTFSPSERDLIVINQSRMSRDIPVEVSLNDANGTKFTGIVSFVDNAIDRKTGTIAAQATIANAQRTLLPGQYVRIRLLLAERPDALLVPKIAIGSGQMGKFVYVAGADGHVEQKFVTLGAEVGDAVVIEKGVAEGDAVITDNLQKIGPGAPVKPKA
ncbi:MAG: efflux transporter periplasmic adaptor subunit [Rhodospirillales bacterium]|nr:efflux transporter periplasmic adaptor subunit [Rhodospirillales bacterium]